jgi:hypothetical protein
MKNRRITLPVALALLLLSTASTARQSPQKTTPAAPSQLERLRLIGGELDANRVTGQVKKGWTAMPFSFSLTRAEIVKGRLQLAGDFALGGDLAQTRDQVTATIGGVMSDASNPWPNARQERGSEPETTTNSCGVVFLNVMLSRQLRARLGSTAMALQLGVVLKPFDNERGEQIIEQICQLLQDSKNSNQSTQLDRLNRLFVSSK